MSLKTGQQQHSLPKSANSTVFQSARDAWISKYKACMKMVNMINDKLSEGLTARTVCKNSGIQVPLLHPQSFQQIHAEKPHMPTWEYKNLSSSLVNNCWRCRPANLFLLPQCKGRGDLYWIYWSQSKDSLKQMEAQGLHSQCVKGKGYRTGTALLTSMLVLKSYRNNVHL